MPPISTRRNPSRSQVKDQNAVRIDLGVVKTYSFRQVDPKFLHYPVRPDEPAAVSPALSYRIGVLYSQSRRFQPDPVVHLIKKQ